MPCCMSPDASVYVVMTTAIPIHSAAMLYVDHVLRDGGVGARSRFHSGLPESSWSRSSDACICLARLRNWNFRTAILTIFSGCQGYPAGPISLYCFTAEAAESAEDQRISLS